MRNIQGVAKDDNKTSTLDKLTVDASMSTVGPAPLLLGLVHLNVRHVEGVDIKTFDLQCSITQIISIINITNEETHTTLTGDD